MKFQWTNPKILPKYAESTHIDSENKSVSFLIIMKQSTNTVLLITVSHRHSEFTVCEQLSYNVLFTSFMIWIIKKMASTWNKSTGNKS